MLSKMSPMGAVFLFLATMAAAAAAQGGNVEISGAWARATPGGTQSAAAYVTLKSDAGDKLLSVSTPVAQKAELHLMAMDAGVMKMRPVDDIVLPPGQAVTLKPGGYHIMLTGLSEPLKEGQSFQLTLVFAEAGTRTVTVPVEGVAAMGPNNPAAAPATPGMTMPMQH
jgi:periplasmic copper chaperone A